MRDGLFGVIVLLAAPSSLGAQGPIDTVRVLDSAWARAYATHDTSLAMALFADDLIVTSANGVRTLRRTYTAVYVRGGPLGWRMVGLHPEPFASPALLGLPVLLVLVTMFYCARDAQTSPGDGVT